jgi:predicted enzyme related to lactoylglutathione lyase
MGKILVGSANLGEEMHKSKLAGFIIDCQTRDLDAAANFWGDALGMQVRPLPAADGEGEIYKKLEDTQHDLQIEVQIVSHPSRVHLDIETDDIDAEVLRLEKLGAKRIQKIRTWWVMEAPTGQRFCVIRAASKDFESRASQWP